MADEPREIGSKEDIAQLDAAYLPFPPFTEWPQGPVREDLWEEALSALEVAKESAEEDDLKRALDFVMRAAAIDTGAIEGLYEVDRGFTITVAKQAFVWESLSGEGASVRALFEGQLSAYELVLDMATRRLPITEVLIKRIHEEACRAQDTYRVITDQGPQQHALPKGEYKTEPNHVVLADRSGVHAYAPVAETGSEMHRLVEELSSREFEAAHPIVQAAYAHYAFVQIHPFSDGNGRVARALASAYLYRAAGIPLLIFADRRLDYFDALALADAGTYESFDRFILDSGVTGLNLVTETLETAAAPDPASELADLRRLHTAQGGLTHRQLDEIGRGFFAFLSREFQRSREQLELPPGVEAQHSEVQGDPPAIRGFRAFGDGANPIYLAKFQSYAPAEAGAATSFSVMVSTSDDESEAIAIVKRDTSEVMRFSLGDIHPEPNAATAERVSALIVRTHGELLRRLASDARESLRASVYRPPDPA